MLVMKASFMTNHRQKEFMTTQNLSNRITVNPKQCGGLPCIRGMRIRLTDVLDLYAAGLTTDEILEEMPDLEREDLFAVLQYESY